LVAEREQQQQMSVDKPDVMSESPAVTSEQSVSVTIETGCTVALQLANEHRQYYVCFTIIIIIIIIIY